MSKKSVDLESKLMKAGKTLLLLSIFLNIAVDLFFTSSINFSDITLPFILYLAIVFLEKNQKNKFF
ncbi:hypothetical protein [Aerococcus urinaeequi]|uniref:hypothetical protein n=1 Tax=Aerococcus urinaeequi TaxID=51665 RepID=UPI003D6C3D96